MRCRATAPGTKTRPSAPPRWRQHHREQQHGQRRLCAAPQHHGEQQHGQRLRRAVEEQHHREGATRPSATALGRATPLAAPIFHRVIRRPSPSRLPIATILTLAARALAATAPRQRCHPHRRARRPAHPSRAFTAESRAPPTCSSASTRTGRWEPQVAAALPPRAASKNRSRTWATAAASCSSCVP